ncbi:hypothetical protein MTR67_047810 [Solanum verrucosum]|uniref:Uncharacterized protein n=1 Tax=Solanum verrucosum TaxID=315347 RepID=A0AAF0ZYY7_SOLVR|nr:hypothetical protein MTR67_047810 [Solanum verrucosum]
MTNQANRYAIASVKPNVVMEFVRVGVRGLVTLGQFSYFRPRPDQRSVGQTTDLGRGSVAGGPNFQVPDLEPPLTWMDLESIDGVPLGHDKLTFIAFFVECTEVDPKKTKAVQTWLKSLSASDIQSFFRLSYCYRWFLEEFNSIALPLSMQKKVDGKAEPTIHTLEDRLRACVIDFKGNWDCHFPLIEFDHNNSYHSSIQMAPFEALYCMRGRSPIGLFEVDEVTLIGSEVVHEGIENVILICKSLKMAQS